MKKLVFLFVLQFVLMSSIVHAWGFRPMAMGGAFTAVADDANCAYWNSAGAAQLDNFKDGESQIVITDLMMDELSKILNRRERAKVLIYYDSINYVKKINRDFGISIAVGWSGGAGINIISSMAYKLPWNNKMSMGISYYYLKTEGEHITFFYDLKKDDYSQGINIDYLWKFHPEWNIGIKFKNFLKTVDYSLEGKDVFSTELGITSDYRTEGSPGMLFDKINVIPALAWKPSGSLKGLIVDLEFFDLFDKEKNGIMFSAGFEYSPQIKEIKFTQKKSNFMYNFLNKSMFRVGFPYFKAFSFGYGFKVDKFVEIGYFGTILSQNKRDSHNIGVSWKF